MNRWLPMLLLSTVTFTALRAWAGCTKDTDCKGDRICVSGACVSPGAPAAAPTPPPAAPAQVTLTEPMIAEIYMKGDVTSALNEAKAAKLTDLAGRLTAISQAYGAAYAARQAGNTEEAIRQYELVLQYDRAVATRDNAYSNAAREALGALYASRPAQPAQPYAAPAQPYAAPAQPYAAPAQPYAAQAPMVAAPTGDRTVSFTGRAMEYTVNGQHCTAPCSMTLPAGSHVLQVRGLGSYRLNLVTDVTRVEAKKGSPAGAIISGVLLASTPLWFWLAANTTPDCSGYRCDDTRVTLAWVGAVAIAVGSLIALPIGIVEAVRTNVTVNGQPAYRASREVKFSPMLAFTGNGGFVGGQLSF